MDIQDIIRIALQEHDGESVAAEALLARLTANLEDLESIPAYDHHSKPLSLVSFRCMLQDTGYPMEVYLPEQAPQNGEQVDWSKLRERWVGWGVEVPGENKQAALPNIASLSMNGTASHPPALQYYLGALIKVYGDVSFKPASTHTFIGLLSTAPLPSPISVGDEVMVPTIHVLRGPLELPTAQPMNARTALVEHLAASLSIDLLSAEYILLALLASPSVRPPALPPLGTLSLNLIGPVPEISAVLRTLTSESIHLPLTLQTLHSAPFLPSSTNTSSDTSSLAAGLLQLAEGTVLVIDETAMGDGGLLQEKAVKNLQALTECMAEQKVRYEYPYMDGLKMEAWLRTIVLSEGKSLVPVDVHIPVKSAASTSHPDLPALRDYLKYYGSKAHARSLSIPEDAAEQIQEDFVANRRSQGASGDAEDVLKRRMKIARLLAVSYADAVLTVERWKRVVEMDEEAQKRMKDRARK